MIYYFSGTGNSHYAASKLAAATGDRSYDIAAILNGSAPLAGRQDVTGFVFPVYYAGLPEAVKKFAGSLKTQANLGTYVFSVITCGAYIANADKMLAKTLGVSLDYSVALVMPDNYVVAYDPATKEEAIDRLVEASGQLEKIADDINERRTVVRKHSIKDSLMTAVMYPTYNVFRITKPFFADVNCIGCGECAQHCPDGAIELKNDKPVWVKSRCQHCTSCINSCPAKAIQFGKKTAQRGRYNIEMLMK